MIKQSVADWIPWLLTKQWNFMRVNINIHSENCLFHLENKSILQQIKRDRQRESLRKSHRRAKVNDYTDAKLSVIDLSNGDGQRVKQAFYKSINNILISDNQNRTGS